MGYDWCSVFDHFLPIFSDPLGPCLEGPTMLAAMAAQTSKIRCGILVVGNTYRHPAVLANIAATLDHISGGRLEWGIGAGWWEMEHEEYHIPYPPIGRRIRSFWIFCSAARPSMSGIFTSISTASTGRAPTTSSAS